MFVVGIDPDLKKSGVAVWDVNKQDFVDVTAWTFPQLIEKFRTNYLKSNVVLVRVEAGWLHKKSNWHGSQGYRAEHIAKKVGWNQGVGMKIVEYLRVLGYRVEEVQPIGKHWKDGKAFTRATGWESRTNQDMRDAALLVYEYNKLASPF